LVSRQEVGDTAGRKPALPRWRQHWSSILRSKQYTILIGEVAWLWWLTGKADRAGVLATTKSAKEGKSYF